MTESSAIIPVVPSNEAIAELVDQKNLFTQIELVQSNGWAQMFECVRLVSSFPDAGEAARMDRI